MKKDEKDSHAPYRTQVLDRALDIMDCFDYQTRELTLTDIANLTGLHKTTAKRLLSNLTFRRFLQQDPQNKRYQLGMRLFELGGIVFSSLSLRRAANPHMDRLRDETGMTVLLGVELEEHLVYADKREGTGMIRISSEIGWRRRLDFGMLGMVLMAYISPAHRETILQKYPLEPYTSHSITDPDAFSLRLARIHQDGFVVEKGEAHEGISGIAAPVRDYTRKVVAALGVAVPLSPDPSPHKEKQLVDKVRHYADAISADLGYLKI